MDNSSKYTQCFSESLCVDPEVVTEDLEYNAISEWDSIGHMALIAALEEAFGISIDIDDVVDFSSYAKGRDILQKYGVQFAPIAA
jgi:acyl carrier protein